MLFKTYDDFNDNIKIYPVEDCDGYIVFSPDHYGGNVYEMWNDIRSFLNILSRNNQIAIVYPEENLIIVEFNHNEKSDPLGGSRPMWVSEDEYYTIMSKRDDLKERIREK